MTEMKNFENELLGNLRVAVEEGKLWFSNYDACRILDIKNPNGAALRIDDEDKMLLKIVGSGRGGAHNLLMISEAGLYSLIFSSKKDSAKKFQKWVFKTVLPSIRQNGGYIKDQELLEQNGINDLKNQIEVLSEKCQIQRKRWHEQCSEINILKNTQKHLRLELKLTNKEIDDLWELWGKTQKDFEKELSRRKYLEKYIDSMQHTERQNEKVDRKYTVNAEGWIDFI